MISNHLCIFTSKLFVGNWRAIRDDYCKESRYYVELRHVCVYFSVVTRFSGEQRITSTLKII